MKQKVTCRPCKEEANWEIEGPNGEVYTKHYQTKDACVRAGRKHASELGCELVIEDSTTQK